MRLSFVLELLLVFLFLAFAAARVIDTKDVRAARAKKPQKRQGPPKRYCACTASMCNCCRDFSLPVVPIKGPGCASLQYLQGDNMLVTMSFGDRVLTNTTVSGRKPKPVCMGLPGGISQFCGRIYGISRQGEEFKACLGLELRALDDIEAALRVSCFKFGPKGVNLEAAPPVPSDDKEEEEDDDDYDAFDLDVDDDDDYDDEGETAAASQDNEVDSDDSADYTGFSALGEEIFGLFGGDDSGTKKKKKIKTAKPVKQLITTTKRPGLLANRVTILPNRPQVTKRPLNRVTKRPVKDALRPSTSAPVEVTTTTTAKILEELSSSSTTLPSLKLTDTPEKSSSFQPNSTVATTTTTTQNSNPTDLSLLQTDVAKIEAVAAIAQQDVAAPILMKSTTPASKPTTKASTVEKLKQNNPTRPADADDDVEDEDDLFDGMIGEVATIVDDDKERRKPSKKIPVSQATDGSEESNESDDDYDILSGVIDDDDEAEDEPSESNQILTDASIEADNDGEDDFLADLDDKEKDKDEDDEDEDEEDEDEDEDEDEGENSNKAPTKESAEADNDSDYDILGGLDDEDDDEDDDSNKVPTKPSTAAPNVVKISVTTTQPTPVKPESNLVESEEAGSPEIEEVTDYESEEVKTPESTSVPTTVPANVTEGMKSETEEKAAAPIAKTEGEDDSEESTDLEIEGDIGLGADDEERQIKKIRQIVGEAKRGNAPANWSIFLRPARRFSTGPMPGSARGDRSSRVHRRMNLERVR